MNPPQSYLNLGCGLRFHSAWTNVDFTPSAAGVVKHDLRAPLPFADNSFDIVYHSHVLEHFKATDGAAFIRECFRVLKPGGVVRIAVPDLEAVARAYLTTVDEVRAGKDGALSRHEWMIIEMYDQSMREFSGGDAVAFLGQPNLPCKDFVLSRWGWEAQKQMNLPPQSTSAREARKASLLRRIWRKVRSFSHPRDALLKMLLAADHDVYEVVRFRNMGEIHKCMYDEIRLKELLITTGFIQIERRSAGSSYIKDWTSFLLDTNADGSTYKPDSLFMEGIKP